MPYRLRKAPKRDLYWVVGEDGSKRSHDPLPLETAKAQMAALYAAMPSTEGGSAQSGFVRRMLGEVKRKNILQKKSNLYAPITSLRKYSTMNSPAVFNPSKLTASTTSKWISDHFGAPKDTIQEYIDNELEGDYEKWKRGKLTFKGDTVSHNGKLYKAKEDTLYAEPPNAKIWQSVAQKGKGRMKGGLENDVTRAYAAMKPMTEDKWIASVKKFNPAAATPANYVKDYLTPWTRRRDAAILDQQPGVGRAAVLPGYTEVRSQAEANALGPGAKYAIRNADGSVSSGTNRTLEDLARFDQEAVDKQVMRENQKKAAEEKYWANQSAVSRFFNRDVVGVLTKIADFGSDVVGAVVPGVGKLIQKGYQGLAPPGSKYYSSAPLGQKILNTLGSIAPSPSQVGSFLGSGHMHGLKGEGFFGDMFSAVTRPIGRVVGRVRDALSGVRRDYPPSVRKVIKSIGAQPIARMVVRRDPIPSFLSYAVDLLTMGQFSKAQQDANYDKMFHLCIEFELAKGPRYVIEKNEVISVALARAPTKDTQIATVGMQSALDNTLNGLLKAGQGVMKERWFVYNALSNNCQDFILGILQGNQQLTPRLTEFVKQPLESIASSLPEYADKLFQGVTDAAAVGNVVIEGRGAFVPPSFEDMVKMGSKRVFALMKRHGYILPEFEKTGEGLVDKILKTGLSAVPVKFRRYFIRFQNGEYIKGYKYQGRGALKGGGPYKTLVEDLANRVIGTPALPNAVATRAFNNLKDLVLDKMVADRFNRPRKDHYLAEWRRVVEELQTGVKRWSNEADDFVFAAEADHLVRQAASHDPRFPPKVQTKFVFPAGSSDAIHGAFDDATDWKIAYLIIPFKDPPTPERDFLTTDSANGLLDAATVAAGVGATDEAIKAQLRHPHTRGRIEDLIRIEYKMPAAVGKGGGRAPASKFQKQLQKAGVSPAAYLKKAQDKAKKLGLSHTLLGFSSDDKHKLQIPNAAGKLIRFGSVGLGDHVLYSLAHDPSANEHRARYLARATKIKGNWKADKYSPNSLAIGVLW